MLKIPDFQTKKELFDFLIENKQTLIAQKKSAIKYSDGIVISSITGKQQKTVKANENSTELDATVIINTTNYLDSHLDVHIPKIWKKSLQENKNIMHLQEHKSNAFDKIIASGDDIKAYTKTYTWRELGYDKDGNTEGLTFDSKVRKDRNEYMFDQYQKGYVTNHSVGMYYVKIVKCINDKDYGAEFEAWEKYYPQIINQDKADGIGYFWAVTEAKVMEGSAVPIGSNTITPTLNIKSEPSKDTQKNEAAKALQNKQKQFFINLT